MDRFGYQSEDRIWDGRNLVVCLLSLSFAGFFALATAAFFTFTVHSTEQSKAHRD